MESNKPNPLPPCLGPNDRVVLFDGICKMCAFWAGFVHRNDPKYNLKLASLQSPAGLAVREWCGQPLDNLNTAIFVDHGVAHTKSGAVLRAVRFLRWPWPAFSVFLIVPWFIRDFAYDFIAANRYKMFGKEESCMIPTPELKQRFLKD